jgi:hypothetical protein
MSRDVNFAILRFKPVSAFYIFDGLLKKLPSRLAAAAISSLGSGRPSDD